MIIRPLLLSTPVPAIFTAVLLVLLAFEEAESIYSFERAHGKKAEFHPFGIEARNFQAEKEFIIPEKGSRSEEPKIVQSHFSIYGSSSTTRGRHETVQRKKGETFKGDVKPRRFIENQFGLQQAGSPSQKNLSPLPPSSHVKAKLDHVVGGTVVGHQAKALGQRMMIRKRKRKGDKNSKHWVFKFQDLPPWTPNSLDNPKVNHKHKKASVSAHNNKNKTISYSINPLESYLLAQKYVYPESNSLTESDREYFQMIKTENGLSKVQFFRRSETKEIGRRRNDNGSSLRPPQLQDGGQKVNQEEKKRRKNQESSFHKSFKGSAFNRNQLLEQELEKRTQLQQKSPGSDDGVTFKALKPFPYSSGKPNFVFHTVYLQQDQQSQDDHTPDFRDKSVKKRKNKVVAAMIP